MKLDEKTPYALWHRDMFDRETPPTCDTEGVGALRGLAALWDAMLREGITGDGQRSFSDFTLHLGEEAEPLYVSIPVEPTGVSSRLLALREEREDDGDVVAVNAALAHLDALDEDDEPAEVVLRRVDDGRCTCDWFDHVVVGTGNPGKKRELEVLVDGLFGDARVWDLAGWPLEIGGVVEDAGTFEGNAMKKAVEVAAQTGVCTLADDSGLVVDALDGRPGVYSARFAGADATDADNNRRLIAELDGVPYDDRTARYVAVLAVCLTNTRLGRDLAARAGVSFEEVGLDGLPPDEAVFGRPSPDRLVAWYRATVEGRIVDTPRGEGGFGYDPHFFVDDWEATMAEVPLDRKNTRSHRARALRKLRAAFGRS